MEDFGDVLYVLAMLAALVFSAIRKSKQAKRRPPMPETEDSSTPYNPMDEEEPIIDELRDLFRPKTPRPEPVPQVVKPTQKTPAQSTANRSTSNAVHHYTKAKRLEVEALDEQEGGFEFNTDELDLRKAVIYSEILNRPYQ